MQYVVDLICDVSYDGLMGALDEAYVAQLFFEIPVAYRVSGSTYADSGEPIDYPTLHDSGALFTSLDPTLFERSH